MNGWRTLLDSGIRAFILSHESEDVSALALKKPPHPDWPMRLILDQIKVRQKAARKIPQWLEIEGIVLPSADLMEQASSWPCALYKASLVSGKNLADLTAGAGIDAFAFTSRFEKVICVERDGESAEILNHNFATLNKQALMKASYKVVHTDAETFIKGTQGTGAFEWVYLDPQRRQGGKTGLYQFSSGSPDVTALMPRLKEVTQNLLVKTSPVLDIARALRELGCVAEVHIVQFEGECKEVLYLLNFEGSVQEPLLRAVSIGESGQASQWFDFTEEEEREAEAVIGLPEAYLYEPGPAFLKSGAFNLMAMRYGMRKLHAHTHLYTSEVAVPDFPGKGYKVLDIRSVKEGTGDIKAAELVLRNFPGTPETLRKKLKLAEGSDFRVFACTLADETKKLIVCKKFQNSYL
ncbi:MAG: RsmD family RNA methyltransferase [Rhodospirillales bacterium]|nr:RsmD family RNA methyltransferase [Alphaproteobacteria bacterium]MCB1840412.1 RsmD family RNA methyltransferase [Alphaproteobacteria bacterium]MCB9977860.1 RsmD family RNA methyltransferase [Rhodospirillales bacterium]